MKHIDWLFIKAVLVLQISVWRVNGQQNSLLQGRNPQPPRIAPGANPDVVQPPPQTLPDPIIQEILTRFGWMEQAVMAMNSRQMDFAKRLQHLMSMPKPETTSNTDSNGDTTEYESKITKNKESVDFLKKELGYLKNSNDNMQQRITNLEDIQKQQSSEIQSIKSLVQEIENKSFKDPQQQVYTSTTTSQVDSIATRRNSDEISMLGLQLNQLYNTVNNTGSVVNDLRGYMIGISGDLNDLDQRSRILKAQADSNEQRADTIRNELQELTLSHERFARNTTATLLLSRFQQPSMKNEVINNLQFQIYDVRNDQTKLSDSIKVIESGVQENKDLNVHNKNDIDKNSENIVKNSLKVAELEQRTDQISDKIGEIFSKTEETSLLVSEIKSKSETKPSIASVEKNYDKEIDELKNKQEILEESLANTYRYQITQSDELKFLTRDFSELNQKFHNQTNVLRVGIESTWIFIEEIRASVDFLLNDTYNREQDFEQTPNKVLLADYVTIQYLEDRDQKLNQNFNDVLNKKIEDSRQTVTSLVSRLDKQVRTLEPRIISVEHSFKEKNNLIKSSFDEINLKITTFNSGLDEFKVDLQLVNTSQTQLKRFLENETKNTGSLYESVQSLNRKLRNNSNELELMRNQITSTGTIISDISLSLADLNIQSEIVEQKMQGIDELVHVCNQISYETKFNMAVLNQTVQGLVDGSVGSLSDEAKEHAIKITKESNEQLQTQLKNVESFYQGLKMKLDELDSFEKHSPSFNLSELAKSELELLSDKINGVKIEVLGSSTQKVTELMKDHDVMLENQRKRIRLLESQDFSQFVRFSDLRILNKSISADMSSLNYAMSSAVERVNNLQVRVIALEILDHDSDYSVTSDYSQKAVLNTTTSEEEYVSFETYPEVESEYWEQTVVEKPTVKSNPEIQTNQLHDVLDKQNEISNLVRIVESQIQHLQESTAVVEEMRRKVEAIDSLKQNVIQNSHHINGIFSKQETYYNRLTIADSSRNDLTTKFLRLQKQHDSLKSRLNETNHRADGQDDISNNLLYQLRSFKHSTNLNLTQIHSLINSHESKLSNVKKYSNKISNDNIQLNGKIVSLKSDFEVEKLQLKIKVSKLDDKIFEVKSDIEKQAHKVREVESSLRKIENKPVEKVDTTQIEIDIEDMRSKIFELEDNINSKFSTLNLQVLKLNNNITYQNNKNINFKRTVSQFEVKILNIENFVNRLEQLNNVLENKINAVNSSLNFNEESLIKTNEDLKEIRMNINQAQKQIKKYKNLLTRIEKTESKNSDDILIIFDSFTNHSSAIHKLRKKLKHAPIEKQVNISRELTTELEHLSDKQEELTQELGLLKKLRKRDKTLLDQTSESLAHLKQQSYQAQIQENADKRNRLRDEINQKIRQLEINHNEHQTTINDLEQVVMEGRSKWNEIKSISNGLEVLRNEILEIFMSSNNRTIVFKNLFNQYDSTLHGIKGQLESHREKFQQINEDRLGVEQTLEQLRIERSSNQDEALQMAHDLQELREKINYVEHLQGSKKGEKSKKSFTEALSVVEDKLVSNEHKIAALQESASTLNDVIQKARNSIESRDITLNARNRDQILRYQDLRNLMENIQQQMRETESQLNTTKQKVQVLSNKKKSSELNEENRKKNNLSKDEFKRTLEKYLSKEKLDIMIDSKLNGYVSQDTLDLKLSSRLKSYVERQSFESALANETYADNDSLKSIISEKLKSYVTKSSFDDVITMFAEDVNNMTMGVTILRSDMESEFENLFNELIFFKKRLKKLDLDDIKNSIAIQNTAYTMLSNHTSVLSSQLDTSIKKCLNLVKLNSFDIKNLKTATRNSEIEEDRVNELLSNFSQALENVELNLASIQTPVSSISSEDLARYETKFGSFKNVIEKKIDKMRMQVNTVIQSVNQARQTLGRKSDVGHTHETNLNDDLLATINNEIAQVKQNVTVLYKDVLEFKLFNAENIKQNKEEYSELQNNVFYLNELITEFDANINHEMDQLHLINLNFNSNLNAATEQIQENTNLINEIKDKSSLAANKIINNFNYSVQENQVQSLIHSISTTVNDLEKYRSNVQKSLNETDGHLPSKIKVTNRNVVENALIDTIESLREFFYKISKISIINGTIKVKEEKDQNSKPHYISTEEYEYFKNLVTKLSKKIESKTKEIKKLEGKMYSQQEEINTLTGSLFDVQYVLNTTALSPEQIFNYSRQALVSTIEDNNLNILSKIDMNSKLINNYLFEAGKNIDNVDSLELRLKEGLKRIDNIVEIEFRPTLEKLAESCEQIPLLDESIKKINKEKADNVDLNSISESLKKTRKLQKEDSKLFNSNFAAHNELIEMLKNQQNIIKENVLTLQINMSSHQSDLEQTKSEVESLNYLTIVETALSASPQIMSISERIIQQDNEIGSIKDQLQAINTGLEGEIQNVSITLEDFIQLSKFRQGDGKKQEVSKDSSIADMSALETTVNHNTNNIFGMDSRITSIRNQVNQLEDKYTLFSEDIVKQMYSQEKSILANSFIASNNSEKIVKLEVLMMSSNTPHGTVNLVVTDDLISPDSVVITTHQESTKNLTKKQRINNSKITVATTVVPKTVKSTTFVDIEEKNDILTPQNLRVESSTYESVVVSWSPNKNVQGYRVTYQTGDNSIPPHQTDTKENQIVYSSLDPSTEYIISVYAMKGRLISLPAVIVVTTNPLPTPAEPLENENTVDQVLITDDDYSSHTEPKNKDNIVLDCNFEQNDTDCWFYDDLSVEFNWTLAYATTPSTDTGPTGDHTFLLSNDPPVQGHFKFIEASRPRIAGDRARLLSNPIIPYSGGQCFSFFYHMYGSGTGSLQVLLTYDNGKNFKKLWKMSGQQGNQWKNEKLTINATGTYQLAIEGIRGNSFKGDIGIDDITLYTEPCPSVFFKCNFEHFNWCGCENDHSDDFDWTWEYGATKSASTGPKYDHTLKSKQNGHYMYIEASTPRMDGDKAVLKTPKFAQVQLACLKFWYHMKGSGIGSLSVYESSDVTKSSTLHSTKKTLLWTKTAEQGPNWLKAQIEFSTTDDFQIMFSGTRGNDYNGDIAIDDIIIHRGHCINNL